jgi:hypothetical protein
MKKGAHQECLRCHEKWVICSRDAPHECSDSIPHMLQRSNVSRAREPSDSHVRLAGQAGTMTVTKNGASLLSLAECVPN